MLSTARGRQAGWLLAATFLLFGVALINGFPLVFPDTGTYLRQAMRLEGILDRPPFYSIFLLPLHFGRSLWPIPLVQDMIVAAVLFRAFSIAFPSLGLRRLTVAVAAACLGTSLPFVSNQIMPDVFSPLIVLLVFCLVLARPALGRVEHLLMAALLGIALACHTANPVFGCALAAAAALLALTRGEPVRSVLRRSALVAALAVVAVVGQAAYGYMVIGRVTPSPAAPFFTLARLIYDGPARRYLAATCPGSGFFLCAHQQDFTGNSDAFLWQPTSPLQALKAARGERGALDEAGAIVAGTIAHYPAAVAAAVVHNAARQFFTAGTVITDCPCLTGKIARVIPELFPRELPAYRASLQNTGAIPWRKLTLLDNTILAASIVALAAVLLRSPARLRGMPAQLLALIVFALLVNAALMGGLSGVTDRYQARLIWLVPFFTLALLLRPGDYASVMPSRDSRLRSRSAAGLAVVSKRSP